MKRIFDFSAALVGLILLSPLLLFLLLAIYLYDFLEFIDSSLVDRDFVFGKLDGAALECRVAAKPV